MWLLESSKWRTISVAFDMSLIKRQITKLPLTTNYNQYAFCGCFYIETQGFCFRFMYYNQAAFKIRAVTKPDADMALIFLSVVG
jgi:hypothetical protein